jgi:type III pantothenate kinase
MKLLLDIGNSSVNWALQEQDEFTSSGAFSYIKNNLEQSFQENLLLSEKPSDVLVSNVAGVEVFNSLRNQVKKQWQQECWQPCVATRFKELKNSYSDVQQMGLDRWLAMVASWEEYKTALCLVGCGTALTVDVVDIGGEHLGGYIVPGIELMQQALVSSTDQINVVVNNQASLEYAKDTGAAINNGAFLAAASTIDHVVDKFSNKSKCKPKCIISGGMAELIKPLLNYPFEYEPNLVLTGLSVLHKASQ